MHILVRVLLQTLWLMQEGVQQAQSSVMQVYRGTKQQKK